MNKEVSFIFNEIELEVSSKVNPNYLPSKLSQLLSESLTKSTMLLENDINSIVAILKRMQEPLEANHLKNLLELMNRDLEPLHLY